MKFTFLSLFPNLISGYFSDSILKRAIDSKLLEIEIIDFREFSNNKYKKVDDFQVSGGAGLVIYADVLEKALKAISSRDSHIIYLTPVAKQFNSYDAKRLASNKKHIIFICGRYEGIDERVIECFVDEVFCIGDYILTGGELASLVMCDCISRHIPNVLGNAESLLGESFEDNLLEAPIFTKTNIFSKKISNLSIPSEYSKGNHSRIRALKNELSLSKTKYFRPDIYNKVRICKIDI
ncbi:tRNA (guanosine(37)-N1)-methyltransferase TrmD [Helicobacter sp. MIT 14-3879]|uniref:tRNA (guanosine(37)-N1)-methyltransferase TrmD n=1 Tax=Helicobacter sp. MIT 14-3879 TaxID=2040649 RepID=UPI000E1E5BD5|nr:tRNA (guanosine(37)-N1)-methyltransferase TrmD [Helicobacter sp. MIT 14-3879]RDU62643.1 tRNA (guanosine(37)-N1)-methyltransferase TrmD [Helicobacter sp. MIT 14-3879]